MLYIYYIKDFLKLTVSSLSVSLSSQERLKNDDSNKYLDPKRENIWKKRSNRKPGWRHYPPATGPSAPWACCHVDLSCSTWSLLFSQGQESQWGKESLRQCHEIIIFFFWPHYTAFGILVPWPGMESVPKLGVLTMRSSFHMLSMPGLETVACSMGKIKDIASPPWWPLSTLSVFLQDKGVNPRPLHELQWNFSILISKRIRTLILVNTSRLHLSSTINYLKKGKLTFSSLQLQIQCTVF